MQMGTEVVRECGTSEEKVYKGALLASGISCSPSLKANKLLIQP